MEKWASQACGNETFWEAKHKQDFPQLKFVADKLHEKTWKNSYFIYYGYYIQGSTDFEIEFHGKHYLITCKLGDVYIHYHSFHKTLNFSNHKSNNVKKFVTVIINPKDKYDETQRFESWMLKNLNIFLKHVVNIRLGGPKPVAINLNFTPINPSNVESLNQYFDEWSIGAEVNGSLVEKFIATLKRI